MSRPLVGKLAPVLTALVNTGRIELGTPESALLRGAEQDMHDLLAALRALLDAIDGDSQQAKRYYYHQRMTARDAIAKATA